MHRNTPIAGPRIAIRRPFLALRHGVAAQAPGRHRREVELRARGDQGDDGVAALPPGVMRAKGRPRMNTDEHG